MANQSLNNPVADYGSVVFGQRFVGRRREIESIEQRVLGESYGNMAIMGLPRIGKSSLAWQSIMTRIEELKLKNTIPIFFQVATILDSKMFFKRMVSLLDDELKLICDDNRYCLYSEPIIKFIDSIEENIDWRNYIQKYFKLVNRLNYKVIYILDEFDSVQDIFNISDFQLLRELSYNPETRLCLVTCSRKTIQEIEAQNGAISNFYGTFSEIRLGMFNKEDMTKYWERISANIFLYEDYKNNVIYHVGCHPFLLDMYNDFCFKNNLINKQISEQFEEIKVQLWNQFHTIQGTLKHENLLDKAIQLVLGPTYDVTKIQEEKLLKYQFIHKTDNENKLNILGRLVGPSSEGNSYVCFSDYFTKLFDQEYWESVDYWPLWTDTEKLIRNLIKIYISETFTEDWEIEIVAKFGCGPNPNWINAFNDLKHIREYSLRTFPNSSHNLIDYTMTRQMYDIFIAQSWDWFGKVFEGSRRYWASKFNFLTEIRNPIAHNNKEFISKEQIQTATDYCNLIIRTIGEWQAKQ